jgi:hypothetical protein
MGKGLKAFLKNILLHSSVGIWFNALNGLMTRQITKIYKKWTCLGLKKGLGMFLHFLEVSILNQNISQAASCWCLSYPTQHRIGQWSNMLA